MDLNGSFLQMSNHNTPNNNIIKIYHQNVRSLRNKLHEFVGHLHPSLPNVICLTEHHLNILEKPHTNIEGYSIGAHFCRESYAKGGTIIYVHNKLQYTSIDLSAYCKEKDIEICAVKLFMKPLNIITTTICRSPSGNFTYFMQQLDNILQVLSTSATHIIIGGDLNINYLAESSQRRQLDNLLLTYNLKSIVNFPTRTSNSSISSLDNFFIDVSLYEDFSINILVHRQSHKAKFIRKMDKFAISDFIFKLSSESWEDVFDSNDVTLMFNKFLNTHLNIFHSSFPTVRSTTKNYVNNWITPGIKTSCKRKRELFLLTKTSNESAMKQ